MTELTRRAFLAAVLGTAAACRRDDGDAVPESQTPTSASTTTTIAPEPVGPDPFTLGVASGDPDASSVVLWTAIDRPLPATAVWEVATDQGFTDVIADGEVEATAERGGTARTVVGGLEPDTAYWYRFTVDGHRSVVARTRTAPAGGDLPERLSVAHVSCQRLSSGYWTALDDVARRMPDVVVHCGDYIYEIDRGEVRPQEGTVPDTLEGYREVWRRYKAEAALQAAHRVGPWLVVWDDHEVVDNYQGLAPTGGPTDAFADQRAAAYRAWWEFTPTRLDPPQGPSLPIHRVVDWGGLARFTLLDTRQHRDDQPCGDDLAARCEGTDEVTMLGAEQEAWFDEVAVDHDAVWTVVVQQVVVHQWRVVPGNSLWNLDQWDGYTGARRRLLDTLADAPNPVVLTGDVHSSWVSDLRTDFDDEDSPVVGVEFVAPGVSSMVPDELRTAAPLIEAQSPHIVWSETDRRGWVLHEVTPTTWSTEYRLVDDASVPDSGIAVAEAFTVESGTRGIA